eukprot:1238640-Rhodomonas_salina.1
MQFTYESYLLFCCGKGRDVDPEVMSGVRTACARRVRAVCIACARRVHSVCAPCACARRTACADIAYKVRGLWDCTDASENVKGSMVSGAEVD